MHVATTETGEAPRRWIKLIPHYRRNPHTDSSELSSSKSDNTTRKLSITVGGVLTFIVSLFLYRDLAAFLVGQQLASGGNAVWDALFIELVLGAAAGIGAYLVVLKLLVEKGILQKLVGVQVADEATPPKAADQVDVDTQVNAARANLPGTSHQRLMVLSQDMGVVGTATHQDFNKAGQQMKEIMSQPVISVKPDDDLFTAYTLMKSTGLSKLPVIREQDGKKSLTGWISLTDILRRLE
jgi:CBS domain-containing protein